MPSSVNLRNCKVTKLEFDEIDTEKKEFPKYTTPLLNLSNQFSQGTRPKYVGQMTDLIHDSPVDDYETWKKWYLETHPDSLKQASERIKSMIDNFKGALNKIDDTMISDWAEDLVVTKTYEALKAHEFIFKHVVEERGGNWREATSEEKKKSIAGFIDDKPIVILPTSQKNSTPLYINKVGPDAEVIYYSNKNAHLKIYERKK